MAVIINELEVVIEPEPQSTSAPAGEPKAPAPPRISPADMEDIFDRRALLRLRRLAH
jgi:hypothetical protein